MDRGSFRDLTLSLVKYSGQAYITDTVDVNALINNRLRKFTEETRCLYSDSLTFTLTPGISLYSLRDTSAFSKELIDIQYIVINGAPLLNFHHARGPVSVDELMTRFPNYLTYPSGLPNHYAVIPPSTIRVFPTPDQAYPSCFAAGWFFHPTIPTDASGDSVELSLPEEYHRAAAYFTASELLIPTSDGQVDYDKIALLSKLANDEIFQLKQRSKKQLTGPKVKGWKKEGVIHFIR